MVDDYRYSHADKGSSYDETLKTFDFDVYLSVMHQRWLDKLAGELFQKRIPSYLDFACGTGRIVSTLESFAGYSCGIDISKSMIESARKKCQKTEFIIGDLTMGQINGDRDFDLITAFRFFGNAQDELREKVLLSLRLLLKPSGYLIINNHRDPSVPRNLISARLGSIDAMDLTREKLVRLVRQSGFVINKEIGIGPWLLHHRLDRVGVVLAKRLPLLHCPSFSKYGIDYVMVLKKTA